MPHRWSAIFCTGIWLLIREKYGLKKLNKGNTFVLLERHNHGLVRKNSTTNSGEELGNGFRRGT